MNDNVGGIYVLFVLIIIYYLYKSRTPNTQPNPNPQSNSNPLDHTGESLVGGYLPGYHTYYLIDPECPYDEDDPLYDLCIYDANTPYTTVIYPPYGGGYRGQWYGAGYNRRRPWRHGVPRSLSPSRPMRPPVRPGSPRIVSPTRPVRPPVLPGSPRPPRIVSPRPRR